MEPLETEVEPQEEEIVEDKPIEEPTDEDEEPEGEETFEDVDFTDLKTVPKQFQGIAKKMQASFTKKMQSATEEAKRTLEYAGFKEKGQDVPVENPEFTKKKENVKQFLASEEGEAFRSVFEDMLTDKIGDMPKTITEMKAEKEVGTILKTYGEDIVSQHIDEIEELAKANPQTPLDMVVQAVLYKSAKKQGEKDFKQKIIKKSVNSDSSAKAAGVKSTNKITTFEEAVEEAMKSIT